MKFAFALSLFLAGTEGFAPAKPGTTLSTALQSSSSYENELGAIDPVGFFDPVGLTSNIDEETFRRYRAGEIKNGRAAMLAVIGYIVPEFYRFPGELMPGLAFKDIPNGIAAINAIPSVFWMATFFAIGMVDYLNSDKLGYIEIAPGPEMDEETMNTRRTNEVSNGRLAMLAFFELVRNDWQSTVQPGVDGFDRLITGLPFLYN